MSRVLAGCFIGWGVAVLLLVALAIAGIGRDKTVLEYLPWTGIGVGLFAGIVSEVANSRAEAATEAARKEREAREAAEAAATAKNAAKNAAEAAAIARTAAEAAAKAAARASTLAKLRQLIADANGAANSLPIILGEAEITLDRAQAELESRLPSPFWEAIEEAVGHLRAFHNALSIIDSRRAEYRMQAAQLEREVSAFALGISVLPDPADTHSRLNRLYREAQSIPHFSIVYEQRRTTATLIVGFRSLGQTIEGLGNRIADEIGSLANSLDCGLANLESSLESSAAASAEQSAALRAELQTAVGVNDAIRGQLREDAEARSETERLALRMLDNIQRRRKPTFFDRP